MLYPDASALSPPSLGAAERDGIGRVLTGLCGKSSADKTGCAKESGFGAAGPARNECSGSRIRRVSDRLFGTPSLFKVCSDELGGLCALGRSPVPCGRHFVSLLGSFLALEVGGCLPPPFWRRRVRLFGCLSHQIKKQATRSELLSYHPLPGRRRALTLTLTLTLTL